MGFLRCVVYLAVIGIVGFVVGRILPKKWFHYDKFPYSPYGFEHSGKIYEKIHIRSWQRRVPDMSRIFPKLMPAKKFASGEEHRLPEMIRETCVAEFIHGILCFAGLHCITLWQGAGGLLIAVLNILGNMPFILIQRYNRPRLIRVMHITENRTSL